MDKALITFVLLLGSLHAQILPPILQAPLSAATWGSTTHFVASCASATTCAIPSVTIPASSVVVIYGRVLAAVRISSTDVAGTPTDCGISGGSQAGRSLLVCGYILSPSSVSSSTVTVTYSGTTGGSKTSLTVCPYSGGTPAIDAINDETASSGQSGTTFTGPGTLTLTGISDCVVEAASAFDSGGTSHSVSAVNGSWNGYFSTAGFADQSNVSSVTVPTWTTTTGFTIKATGAIAFGFSPTAPQYYGLEDFSGGTAGNNFAAADLVAGLVGGLPGASNPAINGGVPHGFTVTDPATSALTYCTAAHHALNGTAPRFIWGGNTYSDANNLGMCFATSGGAVVRHIDLDVPWETVATGLATNSVQTGVVFFKTDLTSANTVNSVVTTIHTPAASEFCSIIVHATAGVLRLELEGSVSTPVTISANTWYQLSCKSDSAVGATAQIWSEDGTTQIGSDMTVSYATTGLGANADFFSIGFFDGTTVTTGHTMFWDKWKICYTGTCPWPMKE